MMPPTGAERVFAVSGSTATPAAEVDAALSGVLQSPEWALLPVGDTPLALQYCDALIAVVDGHVGMDPTVATTWQEAVDRDLPRVVLTVRTAAGRADFDELVAMCHRVLDEDFVVRFLPLYDDDGTQYVGLLDVLTGDIHQGDVIRPGDPEHREITAAARDEVVEHLAYAGLSDEALAAFRSGLPVSLPALIDVWSHASIVPALPGDRGLASGVLSRWLAHVPAAVVPVVSDGDPGEPVGVGVSPGLARTWGVDTATELQVVAGGDERGTVRCQGPLCRSPLIAPGDSLRRSGSRLVAHLPGG